MTYPFGKLRRWSLCGPSCWKLETRNQLVWRLSLGPYDVPTTYFTTSCPVEVACSSGSAPRRPVMIRRATERAGDELKERAEKVVAGARRKGRRGVKAGIVWYGYEGYQDGSDECPQVNECRRAWINVFLDLGDRYATALSRDDRRPRGSETNSTQGASSDPSLSTISAALALPSTLN